MFRTRILFALACVLLFAAGCATKTAPQPAVEPPPVEQPAPTPEPAPAPVVQEAAPVEAVMEQPVVQVEEKAYSINDLRRIPFDYDQHVLTEEARNILFTDATILKALPGVRVKLEGHCDERGSDQYNIALGERRAESARNYLVSLGVAADRLETVSYGEERPLVQGSDESAWAQNRRVELVPAQ